MSAFDAIVIGGGLHGASAALHLAMRRQRVLILERRAVGAHASGASAGGVRTLGRDIAEVPLSLIGMELWYSIRSLVDHDCGFHAHGQIKVAENEAELKKLEARFNKMRALGYTHEELIDRAELRRLVPAISPHCIGGLTVRSDGAAEPYWTTAAFRRKAEALRVVVREGEGVTAIERSGEGWAVVTPHGRYEAGAIVNCAGAWADEIAAMVGDAVVMSTRCSMMIVTERLPPFLDPVIGATGRPLSFKQTGDGTVLIGGGQQARPDREHERYEIDLANLAKAAQAATALFPSVAGIRIVRSWAGLEAQMPDRIPVIGPSPAAPGVFHAFGFSGHGFQLGPIVGSALADLVVNGNTNLPIEPFRLERFAKAAA